MGYTIGEFARKTGLSIHTLRWYEKEGLLFDIERDGTGRRRYDEKDVEMVQAVTCLKATGMSIRDIKECIDLFRHGSSTYQARVQLFRMQRERILDQMDELERQLAQTDYKIWYYRHVESLGDPSDPDNCENMRRLYEDLRQSGEGR